MKHQLLVVADLKMSDVYELMTSLVVPRPIAFVSSLSQDGIANLAPFSYFVLGGINPPSVVFSPARKPNGGAKDTLANIQATGEYVINLVTAEMAEGMNQTALDYPAEVDEWEHSGFTPVASRFVSPARVAESPVNLECKLFKVVGHGDGVGSANYIIGEVIAIHIAPKFGTAEARRGLPTLSRLGGPDYLDLGSGKVFELARPTRRDQPS